MELVLANKMSANASLWEPPTSEKPAGRYTQVSAFPNIVLLANQIVRDMQLVCMKIENLTSFWLCEVLHFLDFLETEFSLV